METVCGNCYEPYSDYLFEFNIPFLCDCGTTVPPPASDLQAESSGVAVSPAPSHAETYSRARRDEERKAHELRRKADRICYLIVSSDLPAYEIEMEKSLRSLCREYFPGMLGVYDRIYGSRFQRLWEQFRDS